MYMLFNYRVGKSNCIRTRLFPDYYELKSITANYNLTYEYSFSGILKIKLQLNEDCLCLFFFFIIIIIFNWVVYSYLFTVYV